MKKLILIPILFLSYFVQAQYIVVKPSQLPAASTINLTDLFILNQGTTTKKVTYSILNTVLKDTFLTKKVTLDSIAALRGDIGTGGSQWTTTPNGISYAGAIFPGSIKKWDAVIDTFLSVKTLTEDNAGFHVENNSGAQIYLNNNMNSAAQIKINVNDGGQNVIETNNGNQTLIYNNLGIGYYIPVNTGTGLNFSGTGKHIRMTSTGTDTTEVFNQTSTGINQVFKKNGSTVWKVDNDGMLHLYSGGNEILSTADEGTIYGMYGSSNWGINTDGLFFNTASVQYQYYPGIMFTTQNLKETGVSFDSQVVQIFSSAKRTTNNITIDSSGIKQYNSGVLKFKTDSFGIIYNNQPHCAIYRNTDLTISATQNIWYKITGFTTKDANNFVVQGDSVQFTYAGSYAINFTISFSGLNNEVWELGVFKGGTLEEPSQLRYTGTSDVGNMSCPVYVSVTAGQWISFRIRNTTDNDDPTIKRFSAIIKTEHLTL